MAKRIYHSRVLVQHDGVSHLSLCYGYKLSDKYLSLLVEWPDEVRLYIPISDDKLEWYESGKLSLYETFKSAQSFYLGKQEDFDGDSVEIKFIDEKDIKPEWWPGE